VLFIRLRFPPRFTFSTQITQQWGLLWQAPEPTTDWNKRWPFVIISDIHLQYPTVCVINLRCTMSYPKSTLWLHDSCAVSMQPGNQAFVSIFFFSKMFKNKPVRAYGTSSIWVSLVKTTVSVSLRERPLLQDNLLGNLWN
jgi:hypothetical protein